MTERKKNVKTFHVKKLPKIVNTFIRKYNLCDAKFLFKNIP